MVDHLGMAKTSAQYFIFLDTVHNTFSNHDYLKVTVVTIEIEGCILQSGKFLVGQFQTLYEC